jgi:hypothetical protein
MNNIEKAMELALSCRRCGSQTDAQKDPENNEWTTYCDCGKTSKYESGDIEEEALEIAKTLPKKK